jgi:hypothetical protein
MSEEKARKRNSRPPRVVNIVVAISILIVMIGVVAFLYGKDVIERPILALFILFAWLGALVGLRVSGSPGRQ